MFIIKQTAKKSGLAILLSFSALSFMGEASATAFDGGIPAGWACSGGATSCGTSGANGVVTTSPEGGDYGWVTTFGGINDNNLNLGGGSGDTNATTLRTTAFSASAGDALDFYFNYVTSDGAQYADYGWARLLDSSLNQVALLFTARTTPSGNSVPGFGMPAIAATITPSVVTIVPGGPAWAPLLTDSGNCFSTGCGFTGWVESQYSIANAGNYVLEFGVSNWLDTAWQSGMAFDGITVGGKPIEDNTTVPEPASLALLGIGLAGLGAVRRRKQAA